MDENDIPSEHAAAIRLRAEALLLEREPETFETLSPEKARQLLHELQVHQIELEMQNEEMHRLHVEMDASRARYFDLYDLAPVGYLTVSAAGLILEANFTAAGLLDVPRSALVKQPFTRFIVHEDQDAFYLHRKQLLEMEEPQAFELRMLGHDRQLFWAHLAATLATDAAGEPELRIVLSDISERKQAEAELRASEEHFRTLTENVPTLIYLTNAEGQCTYVNPRWCDAAGMTQEEARGDGWRNALHEDDRERVVKDWQQSVDSGGSWGFEYRFKSSAGKVTWLYGSVAKIMNPDGSVLGYAGTNVDITERKQAEEELRNSLAFSNNLIHSIQDGVSVLDPNGVAMDANPALCQMTGFSLEELIGVGPPHPYWPPEEYERIFTAFRETMKGGPHIFQLTFMRRNGERFPVIVSPFSVVSKDGTILSYAATVTDVSERMQAQAALASERNLLHALVDLLPTWIFVKDRDSRFQLVNQACAINMGAASPEEMVGKSDVDYYPPEVAARLRREEMGVLAGTPIQNREISKETHDGSQRILQIHKVPLRDRDGTITGLVGAGFDITELKAVEDELRASELFQRDILNSLPAHIAVLDPAGVIVEVNEPWLQFARNNGTPPIEKIGVGAKYLEVCHTAWLEGDPYALAAVAGLESVLAGKQPRFMMDYPCDSPDCARWFAMEVIHLGDGEGAIVAHTDISERKKAEEALRQANQKLRLHFEQTPMAVIEWDLDFRVTQWNPAARTIFGHSREEALGQHASFIIPETFHHQVDEVWQALIHKSGGERSTNPNVSKDGTAILCEWYNTPLIDERGTVRGVASVVMDITAQTHTQQLLAWEKSALESINSSAPLATVLNGLMLGLEQQLPGSRCSVLLLDADGIHLRTGAAPSLPEAYNRAVDGVAIGPTIGSCGTAAFLKQQIIVADIASDPLWADYREVVAHYDLHACWSTPILCSQGNVLGTFANYYREPRHPVPEELELIERAVHVMRIAIERKQAEEEIHALNTGLEQRVKKRTAELQAANASLGDFKAALDEHAIVAITDVAGTITYANDKFCEISKYSREELLGQNHRIIKSGYHPPEFFKEMWRTITSGHVWKGEIKNRGKDGMIYWVSSTIVPFFGPDGKPNQFISIRTDITKRRLAQEAVLLSEERLRLAAEVAGIAVWEWDLASNEIKWDEQMFRIYGLPPQPEGLVYFSDWQAAVLPADLAEQEAQLQQTVATCGRSQREFRITRASDHAVRVIQAAEMVVTTADGKAARVVGINLDITERRQTEEEINKLNADLQSRAAELEAANKELEAFSYSVSHDLRAPLRAVDGFSRMVIEDYATQLDADGQRMLGVIREETQRMGRLIDDLLAFSRLGRQQVQPMPINMQELAQEVYGELAGHEPERRLRLDLRPLPAASGSEALIRQVWVNLIANAIKFTKDRECGEIEIGARDGEDGQPVYYVKDNGAGFDMRYADKLFGVFQRLHNQQEFAGTGVGLALVQRIVQRHGGHVWAEAEVDHGATFYFTIPNQNP